MVKLMVVFCTIVDTNSHKDFRTQLLIARVRKKILYSVGVSCQWCMNNMEKKNVMKTKY